MRMPRTENRDLRTPHGRPSAVGSRPSAVALLTAGCRRPTATRLLLALALFLLLSPAAQAQAPERQRAFVYGINAALGTGFQGSFAPPSVGTLYLLADRPNILSPRMTEIYFWPITNEYKASWELVNEPVAGTIEILQGGQVIQSTATTSYTIHYRQRGPQVDGTLYLGAEAAQVHAEFTKQQRTFRDSQASYLQARQAWLSALPELNRRAQAGEKVTVPPEPQAPPPIDVMSNGLNDGIPITLPAGSYQIRLRGADGAIVPDSERALEVFAPRRSGVGYMVLPETRWTTPEQVHDTSDVIVGQASSRLYLVPHAASEYPARAYALLANPQRQIGENADWTWVMGQPITEGQLEIVVDGVVTDKRVLTPFRVQQIQGSTLGYEVRPFEPDPSQPSQPDFVGFPIAVEAAGSGYTIRMTTPTGAELAGSAHLVRTPARMTLGMLALLAAIPLVVGAAVITRRRLKLRLPRNMAG